MKIIFYTVVISFLLLLPVVSRAEVEINGDIEINNLLSLDGEGNYLNYKNMNIFSLKTKHSFSEDALAFGEFRLKNIGFPSINSLSDLNDKSNVEPLALELREAYIEFYGFLLEDLDLKVGKQRISWGTADGMNPTDNLNPEDLEDPLDFKRKLGVNSLKLSYYLNSVTFTGIVIPIFVPAVFPSTLALSQGSQLSLPPGMTLRNMTDDITLPETKLKNSIGAAKISWNIFNYDMSLSYLYGRDDIPIANRIDITAVDATNLDVNISMKYPKMYVVGYDIAGSIGEVGVWAELGCFLSEKVEMETYTNGIFTQKETVLEDTVYFKYVIGSDYTFKGGYYVNIQFLHGFFIERGSNLGNYIMTGIEKKFLNDELKIKLFGGVDITDTSNLGFMYGPEISYKQSDNTDIIVGAILIGGKAGTTFEQFKDLDELYLKFRYSF